MSCNCNTASRTCDPCAFCTPPGVTGLTTCEPIDPCDGETIDASCVTYVGEDFSCIDVTNGTDLITVLLNILHTYFPTAECCELAGTAVLIPQTTTTTTSTTTTSTTTTTTTSTTTTTTTTLIPSTCNCFIIENYTDVVLTYSFVDCEKKEYATSTVPAATGGGELPLVPGVSYRCLMTGTLIAPRLSYSDLGACSTECVAPVTTTTTTTTTTVAPTYSYVYEAEVYSCVPLNCSAPTTTVFVSVADPLTLIVGRYYRSADPNDTNTYKVISGPTTGSYAYIVSSIAFTTCVYACNYVPPEA